MPPHTPPMLASRFVAIDDGTSLDLATGDRVWIERRVLDDVARAVWPEMVGRLWRLWHPALAPCVDFGFVSATEWFEAYAVRPADAPADPLSAQAGSARSFLHAHDVVCGLKALEPRRRSLGLIPTLPAGDAPESRGTRGPGLGMRVVPRPLEAHVLTALDDRGARGPRIWSVDAEVGSGWRTSWRLIAREARLRGYVPVQAAVLESAVRRGDGRHTSWLALLDGFALLVLHERADWHIPDRQGLARLLVRVGGSESAGTVVLDVVRRGRPRAAAHTLDALAAEQLAGALWVSPGCCSPQWLRARAIAASANGLPGAFVSGVATRLGLRADIPTVHERAPAFAATETADPGTDIDPAGVLERARALVAAGRTALAQWHVQRAAWAFARRNVHPGCARLLVEAARLAASRGDLRLSRHCWREAARLAPAAYATRLIEGAADLAEQWIRQAALVDAEYLLHSALGASRVLDTPPPPRLIALLVTCLCWQARWADAVYQATSEGAEIDPEIAVARVWARLELRDTAGAMADLHAVGSACAGGEASVAQLRIDVASGAVDALMSAAHSHADAHFSHLSLAEDDRVLVPAEGLVSHAVA